MVCVYMYLCSINRDGRFVIVHSSFDGSESDFCTCTECHWESDLFRLHGSFCVTMVAWRISISTFHFEEAELRGGKEMRRCNAMPTLV